MNTLARQRNQRQLFEFEKGGQSSARPPAGHRPDLSSLSVIQSRNNTNSFYANYNYNRNRSNSNTSASLDFIDLKSIQRNPAPQVSSSYDNSILSKNGRMKSKKHQINMANRAFDTLFLVDLLNISKFDEITEINASSQNLNDIDLTALKQLRAVKKADFSDNSLPLEPFSVLQNLEELDMSCNGLKKFEFEKCEKEYMDLDDDGRAWNSLHTLNLSHNNCSNMISDLQLIPLLSNLNLSSNSITSLPSNLMYFTCLTTLDLSNNNLNSDSSLFSLATIPSLQILNLDYNGLVRIPRFQFGFEALNKISLRYNYFEEADDFDSLADILSLQEVNIIGNPITIKGPKYLSQAKKTFANAKIELICHSPAQPVKSTLSGNFRTVPLDPLTLPFFSRAHKRALNENIDKKPPVRGSQKVPPLNIDPKTKTTSTNNNDNVNNNNDDDDVFMTSFLSKADENKSKSNEQETQKNNTNDKDEMLQRIQNRMMLNMNANQDSNTDLKYQIPPIQPTHIPPAFDDEDSSQTNFWSEIPVVQEDRRKAINKQVGINYGKAFNQLQFIVLHPEARPGNISSLNKNSNKDESYLFNQTGNFDGNYYNNEAFVYSSEFNNEYHEGDEIDEIQDLIQNRSQNESSIRMRNKIGFRSRLGGATPIPTARRSRKYDEKTDENSPSDEENKKLTREEINGIIQDMDDKLLSVEKDLQDADDERMAEKRRQLREKFRRKKIKRSGRNSADDYDDYDSDNDEDSESGDRFARLNKQYESIRASLVKTLTET